MVQQLQRQEEGEEEEEEELTFAIFAERCDWFVRRAVLYNKKKAIHQNRFPAYIDRSQARNGRLCRVAVTDFGEFAPAIAFRGRGLLGCVVALYT